jgi:hypothetical protein
VTQDEYLRARAGALRDVRRDVADLRAAFVRELDARDEAERCRGRLEALDRLTARIECRIESYERIARREPSGVSRVLRR